MKAMPFRTRPILTTAALTLAVLMGMITVPGKGASAASLAPHGAPTDGTGTYESCDPHVVDCILHLDMLAQAGFKIVINYSQFTWDATITDQQAYAAHAAELGMKVIWPVNQFIYSSNDDTTLSSTFPILTSSLKASGACQIDPATNYGFVLCFAAVVKSLPGTWGYYIGDELPSSQEQKVRMVVDTVVNADPTHPRLYVAGDPGGRVNSDTLNVYGRSYCDSTQCHPDATVILQDFYPFGTSMAGNANGLAGQIAAGVRSIAEANGAGYGMVLQAHSLAEYPEIYWWCHDLSACPYPTESQERGQRDVVFAQGTPRLVLWYSSFDLQRSDNYAQHWADLALAALDSHPSAIRVAPTPAPPPASMRQPTVTGVMAVPGGAAPASAAPVPVQVTDQTNTPIVGAIIHLSNGTAITTNQGGMAQLPPRSQVQSIHAASKDIPTVFSVSPNLTYIVQLDLKNGKLNRVRSSPVMSDQANMVLKFAVIFLLCLLGLILLMRSRNGSLSRWLGWATAEGNALKEGLPEGVKRGFSPTFRREMGNKARKAVRENVKRGLGERGTPKSISMPHSLLGQSLSSRDDLDYGD